MFFYNFIDQKLQLYFQIAGANQRTCMSKEKQYFPSHLDDPLIGHYFLDNFRRNYRLKYKEINEK